MKPPRILSLQVGRPRTVSTAEGKTMRTSLLKAPADGPVWLGPEDLEGNYQACRKYHGGPDKAICCYASEHYPEVSSLLSKELPFGAFGENFTLAGVLEDAICIGDRYRVGDAVVEVTQPRQPCATLTKRYGSKDLLEWMIAKGATGWYLRTIEEGLIEPGDELRLLDRPHPRWSIAAMNHLMFENKTDAEALAAAVVLPQLSASWRETFTGRLMRLSGGGSPAIRP